jgi:hypothetical protein
VEVRRLSVNPFATSKVEDVCGFYEPTYQGIKAQVAPPKSLDPKKCRGTALAIRTTRTASAVTTRERPGLFSRHKGLFLAQGTAGQALTSRKRAYPGINEAP